MKLVKSLLAVALLSTSAVAAPTTFKVDNSHAFAGFAINHLGISTTHGRFNTISGSFVVDDADPSKSSITLELDANSIDSNDKKRDEHLRGPDFFNVKQFPKLTFQSTAVKKTGDKQWDVTGDLTIKGVKKSVTAQVTHVGSGTDPWGGFRSGFDTQIKINRLDFGVSYMPEGLGKDVTITLAIEGIKQ